MKVAEIIFSFVVVYAQRLNWSRFVSSVLDEEYFSFSMGIDTLWVQTLPNLFGQIVDWYSLAMEQLAGIKEGDTKF